MLDVREMVRRFRLQQSDREVADDLGTNRRTVMKYRKIAREAGWVDATDLPSEADVAARLATLAPQASLHGPESSVEDHREQVVTLRKQGVEVMALFLILRDQHGFKGSYSSLLRFVHRLEPKTPRACVRLETPPGEEAQIDFGFAGEFIDPRTKALRRAWVFVMTLSHSRHQYAELVFDQSVETWLACHVHAFDWFGGVAARLVIDNLRAAISKACFHDPVVTRSYRELATHYNFTIAPCRVATPQHKGKVESGVHYVSRNGLAGRAFVDINAANEYLKHWILERAGTRDHGTTHLQPLAQFNDVEKAALKPLPATRYELAIWKVAALHPDCHITFEKSYYSAPHRLIGKELLVRATRDRVEIYFNHERLATHARATQPGARVTNQVHYPPTLLAGFLVTPVRLREQANAVGPETGKLIEEMLHDKPVDRLRAAQGVMNLNKRYGPARLEAACRRALVFGDATYRTVASILRQGLEKTPLPPEALTEGPVPKVAVHARPIHEIGNRLF